MSEKWTDDETFHLINVIKQPQNFRVLYGPKAGENTSGESKASVYNHIAQVLAPMLYVSSTTKAVNRVKNKVTWLEKQFKAQVKRLKKTGEGIEEMWYIAPAGPDHDTPEPAQNIWQAILEDFIFFKALWPVWRNKPNFVPVCYTTGLGPNGAQTVLLQPPPRAPLGSSSATNSIPAGSLHRTISDSQIDPTLLNMLPPAQAATETSQSPTTETPPGTPVAPSSNKENAIPSPLQRTAPKPSSFSTLSGDSTSSVSLVPQKRGFEDQMIDLQRKMLEDFNHCSEEEQAAKRRKADREEHKMMLKERTQLMQERKELREEFQLGVYTLDEYRKQLNELETQLELLKSAPARAPSPDWDLPHLEADMAAQSTQEN